MDLCPAPLCTTGLSDIPQLSHCLHGLTSTWPPQQQGVCLSHPAIPVQPMPAEGIAWPTCAADVPPYGGSSTWKKCQDVAKSETEMSPRGYWLFV